METDWREILKFSQKELKQAEKEKLCESLSWMEADDIELNFTDLKTLFRLSQDIIKYKTEQINGVLGRLEKAKRKTKTKEKSTITDSPAISADSVFDTITHQEEVIKANKDILEQLYIDIAELEQRKLQNEGDKKDQESESSRGTLSELNAITQLENEVSKRNRHIRKLLGDVKILEEENTKIKEKLTIFKDKLKEATLLTENLTEQLLAFNSEHAKLKELLARMEEEKANLVIEIETLKNEVSKNTIVHEKTEEDIKSKLQQLKDLLKSYKSKIDELSAENSQLKEENMIQKPKMDVSPEKFKLKEIKVIELQEKLTEASEEMVKSANLIKILREENRHLKTFLEDIPDISEHKNESDDGKEKNIIKKLQRKVASLSEALRNAEEMVSIREKELTEITAQLKLLRSDEGINSLIEGIKNKKRHLKIKDEGIKSLVQEVNILSNLVSELQLENATMRNDLGIPVNEKIITHGIFKKYEDMEMVNEELMKELQECENKFISLEIDYLDKKSELEQLKSLVKQSNITDEHYDEKATPDATIKSLLDENEGLRKGLAEILTFMKDNSQTTSGILSMECPSLEAILNSMEARKLAGWFSPHMKTAMELKAAIGGKDALLNALHESRKETFKIMKKLSEEEQKTSGLERTILNIKENSKLEAEIEDKISNAADLSEGEFGSWMTSNAYGKLDFKDGNQIQDILNKGHSLFKNHFTYALKYFQNKFTMLYDKFSSLTISAEDNLNKWLIKEEQYKAEIENLKCQIDENEDDTSNRSPGLLANTKSSFIDRKKYNFLEYSYKHIRTLNENIRNECLETKKERMSESFDYEKKVQYLIISVLNLSDKLRSSIPIEIFLKQNEVLNQNIIEYRKIVEINNMKHIQKLDIMKRLDEDKFDIINRLHSDIPELTTTEIRKSSKISDVEQIVLKNQLNQVCQELNKKDIEIETLENKVLDLQTAQSLLIDKIMRIEANEETYITEDQIKLLEEENKFLKDQQKETQNKHDVLLLQVKTYEQGKSNNDIEINMLRHQILDLQSMGDNKAIIARLSGEVLLAQLQTSESYQKIESLKIDLHKEKQLRAEMEEMLNKRQKVFDIYSKRCNKQFRTLNDIVEILRNQYAGGLPLISAESFFNRLEEVQRKCQETDEKLNDLEDLRLNLMTKHSIYSQILDLTNTKCFEDEDSCPHKLHNIIMERTQKLEVGNYNKKILLLEQSHKQLLGRCDVLERTLVLVSQGFKTLNTRFEPTNHKENGEIEVQDIQISDETISKGSLTYTLPRDKAKDIDLKDGKTKYEPFDSNITSETVSQSQKVEHRQTQTNLNLRPTDVKLTQTDDDKKSGEITSNIKKLLSDNQQKDKLLEEIKLRSHGQEQELLLLHTENNELNKKIQGLSININEKEKLINNLEVILDSSKKEINYLKLKESTQVNNNDTVSAENQVLIANLKKIENDKNDVIMEYKELLRNERQEYLKSIKKLQSKLSDLQAKVDEKQSNVISANAVVGKETTSKYTLKISNLEDKCFKLESTLEGYKTDLKNQQSELERWKELATERLTKMEHLSAQLKERHNHEMESYKAENQHWLSQLNETQREHMELRSRLTEQKAFHVKQLAEKDAHIDHLRSVINNLKTQVLSMQTMLTINDPSFDLSAIIEVEEVSDAASQQGSDRLELKFESSVDMNEVQDDFVRIPSSSTAIWQEPLIERLRREKQLVGKQNAILRRQIKVIAARERRSRLDAQNLKNQVFRITTMGNKVPSAESAALQNKIQSLQAQLTSARRDAHSSVALWDKWKRAQQTAERWQAKFEEKCQENNKLEMSLNLAKSAIARLEKEKRVLLTRLSDMKHEKSLAIEKQDAEESEKATSRNEDGYTPPPVSTRALLDRVEAQQRRIAALELAEMVGNVGIPSKAYTKDVLGLLRNKNQGNETIVSEYERCLAEITSLKGQVLKLESTLLEAQIRSPLKSTHDTKPELDYWKNYCDMLKEENMQLTLRVNALENVPTSAHHQRVSDLEQTVLTLRGLVSKLQSEQKSSGVVHRRVDSRPSSGRSSSEKMRSQVESYRIEISNLKKSIVEKDALLESSKEMLKIAAEREDDLLRENALLQRRLEQLEIKRGLMST